MAEQVQLQEILGTDKKNPIFTLYTHHPDHPGKLLVYFGMCLLEIVDDNPESPAFKLLLARLYNAGVKPQSLLETFCISYTSLRRWGEALKSGDSEKLISVLAGRQHPRKLTVEILSFAKNRFYVIYPENGYSYSKEIRQEILAIFGESISGESLRPYFAKWIDTLSSKVVENPLQESSQSLPKYDQDQEAVIEHLNTDDKDIDEETEQSPTKFQTVENLKQIKGLSSDNEALVDEQEALSSTVLGEENNRLSGQVAPQSKVSAGSNRKQAVVLIGNDTAPEVATAPCEGYQFCHHAGVLLFSHFLNAVESGIKSRRSTYQAMAGSDSFGSGEYRAKQTT